MGGVGDERRVLSGLLPERAFSRPSRLRDLGGGLEPRRFNISTLVLKRSASEEHLTHCVKRSGIRDGYLESTLRRGLEARSQGRSNYINPSQPISTHQQIINTFCFFFWGGLILEGGVWVGSGMSGGCFQDFLPERAFFRPSRLRDLGVGLEPRRFNTSC